MSNPSDDGRSSHPPPKAAWLAPYLAAWIVFLAVELRATSADRAGHRAPIGWLLHADVDAIVYLVVLVAAPLVWWLGDARFLGRLARRMAGVANGRDNSGPLARFRPVFFSFLVAATSLAASAVVGSRFDELPPAYHDEFSYLFQAETFLAGRVSFPSHEGARLFDQMHVLNEGRFASRYFPGAGLWMTPFVALGHPYWGHWLAGALCAVLIFWIGRELAGDAAGLIAGLLTALSPGMALFSNLLLAHHPTLVGLGVFVLGWLRMIRGASVGWSVIAGAGLAFAALCRPMTAAGVALPFGVFTIWWTWRGGLLCGAAVPAAPAQASSASAAAPQAGRLHHNPAERADRRSSLTRGNRLLAVAALTVPLLAGAVGVFAYDRAITGDGWTTPYSLYTDIYTPWHVYGFNNVTRGEKHLGPRVIENYNRWAENLTPSLAARNVLKRLMASWKWSLGMIPLTFALAMGLVLFRRLPRGAWLILAGIISLHAVHIPYWFVGMEDHHYVFESGPLWAVWTGVVTVEACRAWRSMGHGAICWWWGAILIAAVGMNYGVSGGTWSAPLEQGIDRVAFARKKHGQFAQLVARKARPLPALVLVDPDPADRHIDYVTNSPELSGQVLIGRYLPDIVPLEEVKRLFPDRSLFLYRDREKDWQRLE